MSGELVFLVHPDAAVRERLGESLHGASYKVLAFASGEEAGERVASYRFFLPDAILMPLDGHAGSGPPPDGAVSAPRLLERLRSNPLTERIPVVILGRGEEGERRRALRLGLTSIVQPPYDGEEVVLSTRLVLERHRDDRLVSGSIAQLSVPDLLQTAETGRKSGTFVFRHRGVTGTLWMRSGQVVDAEISDGRSGRDAVFAVACWEEGTFEVDFDRVSTPERIRESTSALLLEAMRRRDEEARGGVEAGDPPPSAALTDPPPPPPRELKIIHRSLTLLNVAASYGADHVEPELLAGRFEESRSAILGRHPVLEVFRVTPDARIAVDLGTDGWRDADPEALVASTAAWLRELFGRMERARPGKFALARLRSITEAIHGDMESLGFYRALGLPGQDREEDRRATPPDPPGHETGGHEKGSRDDG
ncbi:MAG: DUF4388 domain-containing protein [Acidobacteriota bacterium]